MHYCYLDDVFYHTFPRKQLVNERAGEKNCLGTKHTVNSGPKMVETKYVDGKNVLVYFDKQGRKFFEIHTLPF